MENESQKRWFILAGAMLLVYVVLTTMIFVYKAKIKKIDQKLQQNQISNLQTRHSEKKQNTVQSKKVRAEEIKKHEDEVNQQPQSAEAHFKLAQSYMQSKGKEKKALEHLKQVVQLDENHPQKKIIQLWIKKLEKRK